MVAFSKITTGIALVVSVLAHPGEEHNHEDIRREIQVRDNLSAHGARALSQCSDSATARRVKQRSIQRRADKVKALREELGLKPTGKKNRRTLADLQKWETVNHNMTGTDNYDMFTPIEEVFAADTSCILTPYNTAGPYYILGEYFRSNVKETQYCDGVDLYLEVQYIDINTCATVPNVAVDVWNANATGTYSGVSIEGNYAADGVNSTYLRGIQLTDHEGIVNFETIFPGHYSGRATHTHLLAHTNVTLSPNGTIQLFDKPVAHIGQLFFPEDLRSEVEATYPYNTNTLVEATSNDDDMWSVVQADASYDPFPKFLYLGDDVTDGLFAWIQIGINATADYSDDTYYTVEGYLAEDGGHAYANGGIPGAGGAPPSGTGAVPSGAAPTTSA